MFHWITALFSAPEAPTTPIESVPPGVRVRRVADAQEGTLAGFVEAGEHTMARVVFCGHRATWVDIVPLGDLEVA